MNTTQTHRASDHDYEFINVQQNKSNQKCNFKGSICLGKHIKMISSFIWYHRIILLFIKIKKKHYIMAKKKANKTSLPRQKASEKLL